MNIGEAGSQELQESRSFRSEKNCRILRREIEFFAAQEGRKEHPSTNQKFAGFIL
jgi:hypothetical protein